jgi:hypothetical protein
MAAAPTVAAVAASMKVTAAAPAAEISRRSRQWCGDEGDGRQGCDDLVHLNLHLKAWEPHHATGGLSTMKAG